MERREFLKKTSALTAGVTGLYLSLSYPAVGKYFSEQVTAGDLGGISETMNKEFLSLLEWMEANGWVAHLKLELGVNLTLRGAKLTKELVKKADSHKLAALRAMKGSGYDDFSGEQLIQPGFPAFSLLYHTLASPRVRPAGVKEYPELKQIDLLENYIYALCNWEQLKGVYGIRGNDELVLAVFAYEYRPAFKTPHHGYADMVYSRTGIGRLGDQPPHYDKVNRCHTNRPADEQLIKHVAVVPARYGLYIARRVKNDKIALVKNELHKGADSKDDRNDDQKVFLQPVRKLFNHDLLLNNTVIKYEELHKSEKLQKLAGTKGIKMLHDRKPTQRYSKDLLETDPAKHDAGSSFLVVSKPAPLLRPAKEDGHLIYFQVPTEVKLPYDNRYFTAYCTQDVENVELLDGNGKQLTRIYNEYKTPRNQPLFVNITHENVGDTTFKTIEKHPEKYFDKKISDGEYYAPLFEDSICDGMVTAKPETRGMSKLPGISADCLPAFSIITAPDFFPQVDPMDFEDFDVAPGTSKISNFYEGGVASLATARIKPNPKMINTAADNTSDTYLAVLSGRHADKSTLYAENAARYRDPRNERGYELSGFLPDVASSVFAPGWDVTYCSLDNAHDVYIGTEGLGSPFIEDMKFCSALNGMWPATSPDASRTYQGSNEPDFRNPTAVPLLDHEIGICGNRSETAGLDCTGWDGEQGPYLVHTDNKWKINFTDLGRADAVDNTLNGKLDMSQLRTLTSKELLNRMDCLKLCIANLPQKNFNPADYKDQVAGYTYLWLVSAESVNWGMENARGLGIPAALVKEKNRITDKSQARVKGNGYLYVFANSDADDPKNPEWTDDKRRTLGCVMPIYICQVTNDTDSLHKIAWAEVHDDGIIKWNEQ